jgi:Icc-related predicted phosphoesterase
MTVNLAAIGDLHITKKSAGAWQPVFAQANQRADVLLLLGDLTDYGLPEEAHILVNELSRTVKIPTVAVLGNHDYESGKEAEVRAILSEAGVVVLDGDGYEVGEVGFVGVKGFCGGFGRRTLEPWGEVMIKEFVREALNEGMKLESGLARLRTTHRVALLHYSPLEATVAGEPLEIYPFLGSSRLEEPLNRYAVTVAFHGHAHRGALEGRTREGIPVYNVAAPLLRRMTPEAPPFRIVAI